MLASKKALIAAVVFITLFLLFRHSSTSSSQTRPLEAGRVGEPGNDSPSRSYPPPASARKGQSQQQVVHDISSQSIRKQLEYFYPYDIDGKFPAYIWQTWKTNPASGSFEPAFRSLEASWTELHPGFVHEVIVDDAAEQLIKYLYASVPQVTEAWEAMPLPILKADFFRYLILLARGGIYTDIDTQALKPAFDWLPASLDTSTVGLVVGIEADPDREDWNKWYARRIQFCQWTIQSKAGHPVLRDIVARITESTLEMKKQGQLIQGKTPTAKTVMEFTGPGVWTDSVFSYLNNRDYFDYGTKYPNITVKDFFGIKEQKKVGDVVILPITGFSPGVGQMGAGEVDDPMAFVHHAFDGSWKPENERKVGA